MEINALERALIQRFLEHVEPEPCSRVIDWKVLRVSSRECSGMGFLTEFEPDDILRLFGTDIQMRWGKIGARLNAARIETNYLFYVDDGYLTAVEGATYGDEWPNEIEQFELYEWIPGHALGS